MEKSMRILIVALLACVLSATAAQAAADTAAPADYYVARLHLAAPDDMSQEQQQTLLAHIGHLAELYDQGVLFMAGPFESGHDGLCIVMAHSLDEARGYIDSDPSVQSGLMQVQSIDKWWAAENRPDNRRFDAEDFKRMMEQQPAPAASGSAAPPQSGQTVDGGVLTLADLPEEVMPPEPAGPADGSLVHFELPSTDFAQTQAFYGALFGWQFQAMGDQYLLFETPGGEGGGFTADYKPGDGGGVFYIYAADVAAKLAEIKAAGGTVVLDTLGIPSYGWIAVFKDPQGNRVGLFSAKNPPAGESPVPEMTKQGQ
jgi:predicted enzyme related to lactoylglutathione lyase/uncharacterized protein YciI